MRQHRSGRGFGREGEAWLRLGLVNLPAARCRAALARWKTPHDLLEAAARGRHNALLATPGITPNVVERLAEAAACDLSAQLRAIEENEIWLLLDSDPLYPPALRAVEDRPVFLWVRGTIEPQDEIAIGIVGTRNVTEYGKGMASRIARDLAGAGVTVVSGLAMGIDTWAHRGALEGGGRTIACCGCGLDVAYPPQNRGLMSEIAASGALLSEFAPTMAPQKWHFPSRNRVISGLSVGLVVVEAAEKSGALITAGIATDQNREVFAVPGNVLKEQSRGPHGLIKQGAHLVEKASDILSVLKARSLPFDRDLAFAQAAMQAAAEAEVLAATEAPSSTSRAPSTWERPPADAEATKTLRFDAPTEATPLAASPRAQRSEERLRDAEDHFRGERAAPPRVEAPRSSRRTEDRPRTGPVVGPSAAGLSAEENRVLQALGPEARHMDAIAQEAGMGAQQAMAALTMLEIKRLARRLPGGMFESTE